MPVPLSKLIADAVYGKKVFGFGAVVAKFFA